MDNNGRSWTDPITGEIYPSGNPHISLGKSKPVDPSIKVTSFREQEQPQPQPQQEIYPQPTPVPQARPMQQVQQAPPMTVERPQAGVIPSGVAKFCEHCGSVIAKDAVVCPLCGCQVAAFQQVQVQPLQPLQINITNSGKPKDKWVALLLCFFFGYIGLHRFYEGKFGTGLLYFFTGGLVGIGVLVDLIRIASKPRIYYV